MATRVGPAATMNKTSKLFDLIQKILGNTGLGIFTRLRRIASYCIRIKLLHVRFEVFADVTMLKMFWVLAPWGVVSRGQCFGEAHCLANHG